MALFDTILKAAAATAVKAASNKTGSSGSKTSNSGFGGSATGVNTYTNNQDAIKAQMNQNSQAWHTATTQAEKDRLHAENERLSGLLGGNVSYNGATGQWSGNAEKAEPTFDFGSYNDSRPTFESSYATRIDDMLDQILNRDKFSYDAEKDPLYQQYKEQYNREGARAMNDTMAAAASNAGGMNSYAMTAAQQANNYYASQVADKIPELYQLAYSMYMDDIDNQVRDLGLLQDMDSTQYNRYRDTMSDWRNDRDFAYNAYRDDMGDYQWEKSFDYSAGRDQIADDRYNQEWEYNIGRDQIADGRYENEMAYERAMQMIASGVMPNSDVLAQAGISGTEAQALYDAAKAAATKSGSGGEKYSGNNSDDTAETSILDTLYGMDNESDVMAYLLSSDLPQWKANEYYMLWKENNSGTLSADGQRQLSALSSMYGSMSNQYKDEDGDYPVEKSIVQLVRDGKIEPDDGVILMRKFGYDPYKWFD